MMGTKKMKTEWGGRHLGTFTCADPTDLNESLHAHVFLKVLNHHLNICFPRGRQRARDRKEGKTTRFLSSVAFFIAVESQKVSKLQTGTLGRLKNLACSCRKPSATETAREARDEGTSVSGHHSTHSSETELPATWWDVHSFCHCLAKSVSLK